MLSANEVRFVLSDEDSETLRIILATKLAECQTRGAIRIKPRLWWFLVGIVVLGLGVVVYYIVVRL